MVRRQAAPKAACKQRLETADKPNPSSPNVKVDERAVEKPFLDKVLPYAYDSGSCNWFRQETDRPKDH